MKRVSFKVAKALKEASYQQEQYINRVGEYIGYSNYYTINNELYKLCRTREHIEYYAPTYIEVWLWLWREKKSAISLLCDELMNEWYISAEKLTGEMASFTNQVFFKDPEEAIITAIEYLVTNDLIK